MASLTRQSPEYRKVRSEALIRDKHKCRVCGHDGKRLHVHHIKPWKRFPKLRAELSNLITLCSSCHKKIYRRELSFASLFTSLINKKILNKIEQTLLSLLLKKKRIKLYSGKIKTNTRRY